MGKPTNEELQEALREAARMREAHDDPHFIAKALLNLHYRHEKLERVLRAAEIYLKFGQEEREHRDLLRAIEAARRAEAGEGGEDEIGELGL